VNLQIPATKTRKKIIKKGSKKGVDKNNPKRMYMGVKSKP
jgi:hypothetical protein